MPPARTRRRDYLSALARFDYPPRVPHCLGLDYSGDSCCFNGRNNALYKKALGICVFVKQSMWQFSL